MLSSKFNVSQALNLSRLKLLAEPVKTQSNPGLEGIGWVLWGLGEITGKAYSVSDVLEYKEVTENDG